MTAVSPSSITVTNVTDFIAACRAPDAVGFVDATTIPIVGSNPAAEMPASVIAICSEPLQTAVGWLQPNEWISHVTSASLLDHPYCVELLNNVMTTCVASAKPRLLDWLGSDIAGRRVWLTHADRRTQRLTKMSEFMAGHGVGERTIEQLNDVTEELLTNAFYDAPVAAGAIKNVVSRTQNVILPDDCACDLAYGVRGDLAIVRVRDPFGALSRRRLVDVLARCARTDMGVVVDETMGGAGLGMWRIFAAATFVAISVVKHRHTEILVGIAKRVAGAPRPFSFHLFFRESTRRRFWTLFKDDDTAEPALNNSVMLVEKPE